MKIAFEAAPLIDANRSGIGNCEAGLTEALGRLYPEHHIYLQYHTTRRNKEKAERIRPFLRENVHEQGVRFSRIIYRAMITLLPLPYRFIYGKEADITHFFNYIVPPGVGTKTVVTVHDMVLHAFPETMRDRTRMMLSANLKRSIKRADLIITDSEFSKSEIIKYYPDTKDRLRVVYCGVDTEKFHPITDRTEVDAVLAKYDLTGKDYFLYLGTIEPRKNLERLIRAYAKLKAEHKNAPLLILGGGRGWNCDSIYQTVKDLKLEESVRFTGYLPGEDMNPLLNGACAFVFPSVYEGFGLPPLEAMAAGTPVLTSTAASLPEVVGECAVLTDPYQIDQMTDALRTIWQDEALRARLCRDGRERAKQFSWDAAAHQLMNAYLSLM